MSKFLETYGVAIFTLVLVAILIAFAGPLGMKIKNATTDKVCQTEQIGNDEISAAIGKSDDSETGGNARPAEPAEAVDQVYCIYYDDGEMTISQNEIEPEDGRTVKKKGFYERPNSCTSFMTNVRFVGAIKPNDCSEWFKYCNRLTEIKNVQNLYTNECVSMYQMFLSCSSLTSLDVSGFDTSSVTNMYQMFLSCRSLTSLDLSGFDTSKVTTMEEMFAYCSGLTNLDVSGKFDTSEVTNMYQMFFSCGSLISLDVSGFDTSKVTNMYQMFNGCSSLTSLNVSGFDTSNVRTMEKMFAYCTNLTSLDLSGKFNLSSVSTFSNIFYGNYNLQSVIATKPVKDKISNSEFVSGITWIIK